MHGWQLQLNYHRADSHSLLQGGRFFGQGHDQQGGALAHRPWDIRAARLALGIPADGVWVGLMRFLPALSVSRVLCPAHQQSVFEQQH